MREDNGRMNKNILTGYIGKWFIGSVTGFILGVAVSGRMLAKWHEKIRKELQTVSLKNASLYQLMNRWVDIKQQGKNLKSYFEKNGYKTVAIYGMSYAGNRLVQELKSSGIEVKYAIDKNKNEIYSEVKLYGMEEEWEPVDVVVVTAVFFFRSIKAELEKRIEVPIISLEDILYEM